MIVIDPITVQGLLACVIERDTLWIVAFIGILPGTDSGQPADPDSTV